MDNELMLICVKLQDYHKTFNIKVIFLTEERIYNEL